jgi:hypothetical protein
LYAMFYTLPGTFYALPGTPVLENALETLQERQRKKCATGMQPTR